MNSFCIKPSKLHGEITIPSSKSHTLRALLFAMMAKSKSVIHHYLDSPDTHAMAHALTLLGSKVAISAEKIQIEPGFKPTENVIDAGNSGQVLRFVGALSALLPSYTVITGDHSIRYNRPVKPMLEGLKKLGAFAESSKLDGYAPIIIRGPITPGKTELLGRDSQPVSALLLATSFLGGTSEIAVQDPGEKPWIDLTLSWLDRFGIRYQNRNYEHYTIYGQASYTGFEMGIPGDFSSAAYPIVAALITDSELTLHNVDMNDVQGDKKVIDILIKMGAKIDIGQNTLTVRRGSHLKGMTIDVNDFVDAITILAVAGCFAEGTTEIVNGAIARTKECDRIHAITSELRKMGADLEERADGLKITSSPLRGAVVTSYQDHRLVLSLSVAALGAQGETVVEDIRCIAKTYPTFASDFAKIGADIQETS